MKKMCIKIFVPFCATDLPRKFVYNYISIPEDFRIPNAGEIIEIPVSGLGFEINKNISVVQIVNHWEILNNSIKNSTIEMQCTGLKELVDGLIGKLGWIEGLN
jgi:hypothetical protein